MEKQGICYLFAVWGYLSFLPFLVDSGGWEGTEKPFFFFLGTFPENASSGTANSKRVTTGWRGWNMRKWDVGSFGAVTAVVICKSQARADFVALLVKQRVWATDYRCPLAQVFKDTWWVKEWMGEWPMEQVNEQNDGFSFHGFELKRKSDWNPWALLGVYKMVQVLW